MSESSNLEVEEWRFVPGYERLYQASSLGRVRSVDRVISVADGTMRCYRGRILKQSLCPSGYPRVNLSKDGRFERLKVHRIVASAFIGPIPDEMHVCHNDGTPTNNRASNLRIDTPRENQRDRIRHGTHCRGQRAGTAKLTEEQARAILADFRPPKVIAAEYGIHRGTVSSIHRGETWAHLQAERYESVH